MKIKALIAGIIVFFIALIGIQRMAMNSLSEKAAAYKAAQNGQSQPAAGQAQEPTPEPTVPASAHPDYPPINEIPSEQAEPGFAADFNLMLVDGMGNTFYKLFRVEPKQGEQEQIVDIKITPCSENAQKRYAPDAPVCTQLTMRDGSSALLTRVRNQLQSRVDFTKEHLPKTNTYYNLSGWPEAQTVYNEQGRPLQQLVYTPESKVQRVIFYEPEELVEVQYTPAEIRAFYKDSSNNLLRSAVYAMDGTWTQSDPAGVKTTEGNWQSNAENKVLVNGEALFPTQFGWPDPRHYCQVYPAECVAKYQPSADNKPAEAAAGNEKPAELL